MTARPVGRVPRSTGRWVPASSRALPPSASAASARGDGAHGAGRLALPRLQSSAPVRSARSGRATTGCFAHGDPERSDRVEGDRRRGGGPVREPCRGPRPAGLQGRRSRRFARRSRASSAAPLGYSSAEDGPSGPVSRRRVDDLPSGGNRTNIKKFLGTPIRRSRGTTPSTSRITARTRLPERRLTSVPTLDLRS
jgi:hypothetical protein